MYNCCTHLHISFCVISTVPCKTNLLLYFSEYLGFRHNFLAHLKDLHKTNLQFAVSNIPKIVKLAENLIKRLNNLFKVITGFTNGLTEFFTKFNAELGLIMSGLGQIDLQSISDKITNIVTRLQQSFKRMESNFIREVLGFSKMSDKDLIKNFGTE